MHQTKILTLNRFWMVNQPNSQNWASKCASTCFDLDEPLPLLLSQIKLHIHKIDIVIFHMNAIGSKMEVFNSIR